MTFVNEIAESIVLNDQFELNNIKEEKEEEEIP